MADFHEMLKKFNKINDNEYLLNSGMSIEKYLKIIEYIFDTSFKTHDGIQAFKGVKVIKEIEDWLSRKVEVYNFIILMDERIEKNDIVRLELLKLFSQYKTNFYRNFGDNYYLSFKVVGI